MRKTFRLDPEDARALEREILLLGVEEEAQSVLRELVLVEVGAEVEPADHVVGRDLDRALADLVVGHLLLRLEREDREIRSRQREVPREKASGDSESGARSLRHSEPLAN